MTSHPQAGGLLSMKAVLTQVEVVLHAVAHEQNTGNGVEQSYSRSVPNVYQDIDSFNLRAAEFLLK